MASEPDDYQTISDNCPGYMVLISEGIICTRCAGEKRHKRNDCPKAATAADLATDNVLKADPDEPDNVDSGMESLSDTSSISSESTARSDSSEMRVTNAHQPDQGGNHPQDSHLPRRGFARPAVSSKSTQPDRTSHSPPNRRTSREPSRAHKVFGNAYGQAPVRATDKHVKQSRHDRDIVYDPNPPASTPTHLISGPTITTSTGRPSKNKHSSVEKRSDKTRQGSHPHDSRAPRSITYEATEDRLPSKSLVDTSGKFDYSNTTCPSSFGFGRLPSEAMG